MHRNVQKEFIDLFPSNSSSSSNRPIANVKSPIRTSVNDVIKSPQHINTSSLDMGHWNNTDKHRLANNLNQHGHNSHHGHNHHSIQPSRPIPTSMQNNKPKEKEKYVAPKQQIKSGYKKLFIAILISILGAFIYSAFSYTFTDNMFSRFGITLFSDDGQPKLIVVIMHTLLFALLIYLIFFFTKLN